MDFFYYILAVWGATHIMVSSKIMSGTRDWFIINLPGIGYMMDCYQCSSFWISMVLYPLFNFNVDLKELDLIYFKIDFSFLVFSFIGSGLISFISTILSFIITKAKR